MGSYCVAISDVDKSLRSESARFGTRRGINLNKPIVVPDQTSRTQLRANFVSETARRSAQGLLAEDLHANLQTRSTIGEKSYRGPLGAAKEKNCQPPRLNPTARQSPGTVDFASWILAAKDVIEVFDPHR